MGAAEVFIPITFFVMAGLVFISRGEIGKAIAHAIRVNATDAPEGGGELLEEVAALRREVEQIRLELAETHERLDFTERLLAQQRAPEQLPRAER
jgi:5-bromo-4-chloroindolyl phosphate hydrolysis protein